MGASLRAGLVLALIPLAVGAQPNPSPSAVYPSKPVRMLVGFTPGSATDITARIFAQTLAYAANGAMTIAPGLQANLPYDPARDLSPISLVLRMPSIVAVNNDVPAKSLQELIALAKAQPGKLSYATPGNGTPQHVGGELLKSLAGVDIVHVPYRGAQFTDVISGRVPITLQNAAAVLPSIRDGKLRALAVTSLQRSPNMPELPTVAESGFPGFEATSWFALDTIGSSPAELAAIIKADIGKWARVIKEAGITANE